MKSAKYRLTIYSVYEVGKRNKLAKEDAYI